ncbi:MAG: methyltransferase domain-containing protein [Chitinophagaceae bacterium]|nr:methyltransferase domain-containing protein [Chitinophagaceae bacterium]
MKALNTINTYLGGHAVSIAGLKKIASSFHSKDTLTICEIGCGGGDNLLALAKWCKQKNVKVDFIGIDIKPACIEFAKQQCDTIDVQWISSDYLQTDFSNKKPDIIFSSLFCHHFKEDELVQMLHWMKQHAAKGFFINDLHRHPLAYYSIKLVATVFSRSYLVKNDAPLSVARGFKRNEWQQLLEWAGIKNYSLQWKWAFRHLIICSNG